MTPVGWAAIAAGTIAAWALAALGLITGFHRLAQRRDALITRALETPIDPWDYELRTLLDETLG